MGKGSKLNALGGIVEGNSWAEESRLASVSRRHFLQRSAIAVAMVSVPGVACSPAATSEATSSRNSARSSDTTGPTTATTNTTAAGLETTATTSAGTAQQMRIDFTYLPNESGQVHFPYIAVWIEDDDGELVNIVSLWFKSDEAEYLEDLFDFVDAADISDDDLDDFDEVDDFEAISGPTRVPGAHSVVWDLTDSNGVAVPPATYHVCIEAAREDGPYQLVTGSVAIGETVGLIPLEDDGELIATTLELT